MDYRIAGKTAVVAASSKGLGRAIALGLAREGCRVVINGRTPGPLEETAHEIREQTGAEVLSVAGSVADPADCDLLIAEAARVMGGVDILVTNTGGPAPGTFDDFDDDAWREAIDLTLLNVVRLIRAARPHMAKNHWGRVVNLTSVSAREPIAGLLLSNALRAAVHGLAKTLSRELAPDGILVNNVCPGLHRTDRLEHLAEVRAKDWGCTTDEAFERLAATIPLKRLGDPSELANAAVFLCSEAASFVTGQSIVVDGGATAGVS
ncbi:MAG: SDR family oxidoreductase [Phycisphaerales bacterium JB040]